MPRLHAFLAAAVCLALFSPVPLSAKAATHWYQPHYMAKVEDASSRLQFLSPHFAPVDMGKNYMMLTTGFTLTNVSRTDIGINLFFTSSGTQKQTTGLFSTNTVMVPFKKDIVTSIAYADIDFFEIWNFPKANGAPAPWCVVPAVTGDSTNNVICVPSQEDAQGVADALATLAVASGRTLRVSSGMAMTPMTDKELRKHPEQSGCLVREVDLDGPPALAGVREGDIIHTLNGIPCAKEPLQTAIAEATAKPEGGVVRAEILRKGNPMALEVRFPHVEVNAAQLRQQSADLAQQTAPSSAAPASGSAPARGGFHLGISVRPIIESDLAALGLAKPQGVLVTNIEKGSLAEQMQIEIGDAITAVNGANVVDADAFAQIVRSGTAKRFHVLRKGQALDLMLSQSM